MANKFSTVALFLAALMVSTSCSNNSDQEGFPKTPSEGESYTRNDGSTGVWNAMMGYWVISSMINGNRVNNHYYPASNKFTNASGKSISRPAYYATPKTSRSSGFGSTGSRKSSGS